jgi:hypothetical protein
MGANIELISNVGPDLPFAMLEKVVTILHTFLPTQYGDVLWSLGSLGYHKDDFPTIMRDRFLAVISRYVCTYIHSHVFLCSSNDRYIAAFLLCVYRAVPQRRRIAQLQVQIVLFKHLPHFMLLNDYVLTEYTPSYMCAPQPTACGAFLRWVSSGRTFLREPSH